MAALFPRKSGPAFSLYRFFFCVGVSIQSGISQGIGGKYAPMMILDVSLLFISVVMYLYLDHTILKGPRARAASVSSSPATITDTETDWDAAIRMRHASRKVSLAFPGALADG